MNIEKVYLKDLARNSGDYNGTYNRIYGRVVREGLLKRDEQGVYLLPTEVERISGASKSAARLAEAIESSLPPGPVTLDALAEVVDPRIVRDVVASGRIAVDRDTFITALLARKRSARRAISYADKVRELDRLIEMGDTGVSQQAIIDLLAISRPRLLQDLAACGSRKSPVEVKKLREYYREKAL